MRVFTREPALGLTALVLVGLMIAFIIIPQVQVVIAPGPWAKHFWRHLHR